MTTEHVYALLGIKHQYMSRWRNNIHSTLTKNRLKHQMIVRAGELFRLTENETEKLANKAGLTLFAIKESNNVNDFAVCFNGYIASYKGKVKQLCELSSVSERMFRYIKMGEHISKEPLLALLLTMKRSMPDIQNCLAKAGYALSRSLPTDVVILWMFDNGLYSNTNPVYCVNEILYSLGLPLLMTRAKMSKQDT